MLFLRRRKMTRRIVNMIQDIYSIRIKKSIILLVFLITSFSIAEAKTLYVNGTTGSDSTTYTNNDIGHPWATLGRATWGSTSRTSPNASQAAAAGDTVLVSPGTYYGGNASGERYGVTYQPANSGTAGNPITFQCNTPGTCILTHTGVDTAGTGGPIIGASQRHYITWDGFYINEENAQYHSDTGVIVITGESVIANATNHVIKNCTVKSRYSTIGDNHSAIRIDWARGITIRNNRFNDLGGPTGENQSSILTYDANDLLIENNTFDNNTTGINIKGQYTSQDNITIRYNIVKNCRATNCEGIRINTGTNIKVYQNIVYNHDKCFVQNLPLYDAAIYNNTFDECRNTGDPGAGTYGIYLKASNTADRVTFKNNIVSMQSSGYVVFQQNSLGFVFDYNNYYAPSGQYYPGSTFAGWKAATGDDTHSITADPRYVNRAVRNYRLQAGSPALNASDTGGPVGAYITGNEIIGFTSPPNGGTQVLSVPPIQSVN